MSKSQLQHGLILNKFAEYHNKSMHYLTLLANRNHSIHNFIKEKKLIRMNNIQRKETSMDSLLLFLKIMNFEIHLI